MGRKPKSVHAVSERYVFAERLVIDRQGVIF